MITVYFDTSVWMGIYDPLDGRTGQKEIELAIKKLIELHRIGKIQLVTSRQVEAELQQLLSDPSRASKAQNALTLVEGLNLRKLHRTPADLDKMILDEARLDQKPNLPDFPAKESDRDIAEYLTANRIMFFVSLDDRHFISKKTEIEQRLGLDNTQVVTPQDLVKARFTSLDKIWEKL